MIKRIGRKGKRNSPGDRYFNEVVTGRQFCEVAAYITAFPCFGKFTPHHKIKSLVQASRHDPKNGLCICTGHHGWIHNNANYARQMGWIIDSKSNLL